MLRYILAGCVLIAALAPPSMGWGRDGHALVAIIAERNLNAKARAEVQRLLAQGETLASIASWADEIRPERRETSTWHYINIPITVKRGDWHTYCPSTDCVISIIPKMQETLRSATAMHQQRYEALKYLVHFVGDMHQPLHCGDNGDRGGNDVQVVFNGKPSNLHAIWDYSILEAAFAQDSQLKARLGNGPGRFSRSGLGKGSLEDWLWESQTASRDVAYKDLPAQRPAVLGAPYTNRALPVIRKQIERAGVRLARILNETLGK